MRSAARSGPWRVEITPTGLASLCAVGDRKTRREIGRAIDALAGDPDRGKALEHPLLGLRSAHAGRDRWRVVYEVRPDARVVVVLLVGRRRAGGGRDVYAIAADLLERLRGRG